MGRMISGSIRKIDDEWLAEAPIGTVKVRFAEKNKFGVLDHEVTLASGIKFYNPLRIFPNKDGSEVIFTLYRQADMPDQKFADDAGSIQRDLKQTEDLTRKINF